MEGVVGSGFGVRVVEVGSKTEVVILSIVVVVLFMADR